MVKNIFDIFKFNAINNPNHPAIILSNNKFISYKNLLNDAENLSYKLSTIGIRKDDPICIISEKSFEAYKLILACIKIGAPYFFLDPDQPKQRMLEIIKISQAKLILTEKKNNIQKSVLIKSLFTKKKFKKKLEIKESAFINDAYYMFTSGSSGKPKGAIISQHNIKYLIDWANYEYNFNNSTIHTALNPIFFDNSVFDFYATLGNGGTLVVLTNKEILDPQIVSRVLEKNKCNSWFSVPSLIKFYLSLKIFHKRNFKKLKRFIFGGEGFPTKQLKDLYNIYGNSKIYSNVYGPTECTCICSSYDVKKEDMISNNNFPPIGNLNYYFNGFLYDEIKKKSAKQGELVLLGPAVGKGYLENLDNSGFKINPIEKRYKEISYFTGDIMKYDKKKRLIFVSRKDNQIKHMGFRIEIEEIESRIRKIKFVDDVVITFISNLNKSMLLASIKTKKKINLNYKKILPKYMTPKYTRLVKDLPKNKNGKFDRLKIRKDITKFYREI
tara:strand:+ start:863 stop:2356 length:1494 start_codon:yes stop_codon:yes gene_type:complete